jgi:hypothetical protein
MGEVCPDVERKEGLLFLKKKKQKDFERWARGGRPARARSQKFFASFFQKRRILLDCLDKRFRRLA